MKKAVSVLAIVVGTVAAAKYVPGFWNVVPEPVVAAVPNGARAFLNVPEKAKAPPAGQQAQAGPGAGGPPRGGPGGGARVVPVSVAPVKKKSMPFQVEATGTVQAIASVTIRSRVDSQINEIHFRDGADVKAGDVLVTLDARAIEAQLRQAEATLARDRATLDLNRRTLKRGEDLATQSFATQQRLDENRAAVTVQEAQVRANEALVENLKTQHSYYTIRAPISGKAGLANLKPGNIARSSDGAIALTTINQISPIYVSFALPQRYFEELRASFERGDSRVEATPIGQGKPLTGKLAVVENTIDNVTGTIGVRATFDNPTEALWPGAICNVKVVLREEKDAIVVPRESVLMGQRGNYVFVVAEGAARMRPVTVSRTIERETIVTSGLKGDETVITDGQLLVTEGARVQPKAPAQSSVSGTSPDQRG